ncbi:MAG: thiamine pyrophosphate-binding protein [Acidimicrobiia bacterium]|nr:thiamine pyrophosphate-binding protein [Acidimicrobiia bacterium]
MARVDGGELFVRALAREGVTHLFGLPGGHINPIWWAAPRHDIKIIDTRHEAGAAHAAEGFALATGVPGVCAVTAAPGVTNALTGIATANHNGTPMVVLAGASSVRSADSGEVETLDQLAIVRPVTKWARRIDHLDRIPEYVAAAFKEAVTGRPGPVYLEIAIDLVHSQIEEDEVVFPEPMGRAQRAVGPAPGLVEQAAALLAGAKRPAIVAGSGVWWSGAADELRTLAERGIPVATRRQGRGTVPDDHPLCVGRDWQNLVFQADVLLVVGTQLDYFFGFGNFPHLDALIQVDLHPAELGRNRIPVTVPILGDARVTLAQLVDLVPRLATDEWVSRIQGQYAEVATRRAELGASDVVPIHPFRLCAEVAARLEPDATVVGDASNMLMFVDAAIPAFLPGRNPAMSTLGTIGHGIGYAIGAAAARPGSQVVWMVGDGSFGFNAMELDTALRHDMPIVTIVMNNRGWSAGWVPLGVRHYERMAPGFDGEGIFVETPDELGPALDTAFAASTPTIVNVMLDPAAPWYAGRYLG